MATIKVPREVYTLVEKTLAKAKETVTATEQRVKEAQERYETAKKQVVEIEESLKQMEPSSLDAPLVELPRGPGRPRKDAS